jgi:2-methylcitrate dehydratase PrpD
MDQKAEKSEEQKGAIEMTGGVTEKIANFIVNTQYNSIPKEAIFVAKNAITDGLGVALAGTHESAGITITEFAKDMGETGKAMVIGQRFRTSPLLAALVNGTLMHALAFDDVATSWIGHPTAVILPAALAIGETSKASGKELLEAYLLGCEVAAKIGQIAAPRQYELNWHNTSTIGTVGAAAACAKILKSNEQETRMILGIAASEACGLRGNFGSMTKPLHAGLAARNGVMASMLAKRGFSANESIIESPAGFAGTFLGEKKFHLSQFDLGLGKPFDIISPGRTIKPYPCCRDIHSCIDAVIHLIKEYDISADNVAHIEYQAGEVAGVVLHSAPETGLQAKLSIEYCIAIGLLFGEVRLGHFTDEMILEPRVQSVMEKISSPGGEEIEPMSARVVIKLKDGKEYSHTIRKPKGDPENPISQQDLILKYKDCASRVLPDRVTEQSLRLLLNLESLKDLTDLTKIFICRRKFKT